MHSKLIVITSTCNFTVIIVLFSHVLREICRYDIDHTEQISLIQIVFENNFTIYQYCAMI